MTSSFATGNPPDASLSNEAKQQSSSSNGTAAIANAEEKKKLESNLQQLPCTCNDEVEANEKMIEPRGAKATIVTSNDVKGNTE